MRLCTHNFFSVVLQDIKIIKCCHPNMITPGAGRPPLALPLEARKSYKKKLQAI